MPADGRVAPRSGLASKHSIDVGAGVIDADYRGPVKVLLFNFGDGPFAVKEGDRIAQLVLERVSGHEILYLRNLTFSCTFFNFLERFRFHVFIHYLCRLCVSSIGCKS